MKPVHGRETMPLKFGRCYFSTLQDMICFTYSELHLPKSIWHKETQILLLLLIFKTSVEKKMNNHSFALNSTCWNWMCLKIKYTILATWKWVLLFFKNLWLVKVRHLKYLAVAETTVWNAYIWYLGASWNFQINVKWIIWKA